MVDLSNLPRDITPEQFFDEILPEILGEIQEAGLPAGTGSERLQFHVTGDGACAVHIGLDAEKNFEIEYGTAAAPPIAVTTGANDLRSILAGDLRDKIKAATGGVAIGPKQLRKSVMPDSKLQRIKALRGDIKMQIEDKEEGITYAYTLTLGGGTPNTTTPMCTVSLDVATLLEIVSGKQQAQQLFFAGKLKVLGDMTILMGLMAAMSAPA